MFVYVCVCKCKSSYVYIIVIVSLYERIRISSQRAVLLCSYIYKYKANNIVKSVNFCVLNFP